MRSVWNSLLFSNATHLTRIAVRRRLEAGDLPPIRPDDGAHPRPQRMSRGTGSIVCELWRCRPWLPVRSVTLTSARLLLAITSPVLIYLMLAELAASSPDWTRLFGQACLLVTAGFLEGMVLNQSFYWDFRAFQTYEALLGKLVYGHAIALDTHSIQELDAGSLVSFVANDCDRVAKLGYLVGDTLYTFGSLVAVALLLGALVDPAASLAVLVAIAIIVPLARLIAGRFSIYDSGAVRARDQRLGLLSWIVAGIRTVKLYRMEDQLRDRIEGARRNEVECLKAKASSLALSVTLFSTTIPLVTLLVLLAFYWQGRAFDSATIFAAVALISLLEIPFTKLTDLMTDWMALVIGARRLSKFFGLKTRPGREPSGESRAPGSRERGGVTVCGLQIRGSSDRPILSGIDLAIRSGEAVAIVGHVGSGKTVLLEAIAGVRQPDAGQVLVSGKPAGAEPVSFVPQHPFLMKGTIRENLLFGSRDEIGLDRAVRATGLAPDLAGMDHGLDLPVSDLGTTLSGGQRQRIALARAALLDTDLILLDDPFSALDGATQRHVQDNLLFGLWKDRTRLVVTHRVSDLQRFDRIILLKDGEVEAIGSFAEIGEQPAFRSFCTEESGTAHTDEPEAATADWKFSPVEAPHRSVPEDRRFGHVPLSTYRAYIAAMAGNRRRIVLLFATLILVNTLPLAQNLWLIRLSTLGGLTPLKSDASGASAAPDAYVALAVYGVLASITATVVLLQRRLWFRSAIEASKRLHERALAALLRTDVGFFDTTSGGVILNRFSRDLIVIESDLRWTLENAARQAIQATATLGIMAVASPVLLAIVGPCLAFYVWLQGRFRAASREIKRLALVEQSPLYAQVTELLEGRSTIATAQREHCFFERFGQHQSAYQRCDHARESIDRWFSVRVPLGNTMVSTVVIFGALYAARQGTVSPGFVGLAFTYVIGFWPIINWCVRTFAMTDAGMTSVERVSALGELPPEERGLIGAGVVKRRPAIVFERVTLRYRGRLSPALEDATFSAVPGGRTAVIGRTGSGKSTVAQALLRLVDIEDGRILIGSTDIRTIPLSELREKIAVVPQSPVLFHGSIRDNLDPSGKLSDREIEARLMCMGLDGLLNGLSLAGTTRKEGTPPLGVSVGERQIICFARALLRRPLVLVLDEATSSVDPKTDAVMNRVLYRLDWEPTVLVIAHRSSAVRDCDRYVHLQAGRVTSIDQHRGGCRPPEAEYPSRSIHP